jgi:TolA-binding protein
MHPAIFVLAIHFGATILFATGHSQCHFIEKINHMKNLIALTFFVIATAGCSGGSSSTSQTGAPTTSPATTAVTTANQPIIENEDLTPGLKGVDANNNGIRDDIDRLIAKKYSVTPQIRKAVEQRARTLQKFMEATDKTQARMTAQEAGRAISCTFNIFPDSTPEGEKFRDQSLKEVEALTANTKERFAKYWNSNGLVGGMVFRRAEEPVCD